MNSPWLNGKGDVVKAVKEACDKYGLKFGVYLSPWDRNAPSYGDSPEYNKLFIAQLTELLTSYGTVHEIWFDGACGEGPNGKKQEYDWKAYHEVIRRLQPRAVTAIMGDDVRWVGNEHGLGRPMEWSATVRSPNWYDNPQYSKSEDDLGSREQLKLFSQLFWFPSEVDVSIRPGWFYHKEQDNKVKSLAKLIDIYFESVGYNSVLLLNVPPDTRGLIHENDAARLREFGNYIRTAFADNRIANPKPMEVKQDEIIEFPLKKDSEINVLLFQEDIGKGQRMESYTVEALIDAQWKEVAQSTTIGHKRLIRIPAVKTSKIRLKVNQCRSTVNLKNVGAYYAQPLSEKAQIIRYSDINTWKWKLINLPDEAKSTIDGNPSTFWKTEKLIPVTIDMGEETEISGFTYIPATEGDISGTVFKYSFYISRDGKEWIKCDAGGEFSNIKNNPIPQFVHFGKKYKARYFRFEPVSEIDGKPVLKIAELGVLSK